MVSIEVNSFFLFDMCLNYLLCFTSFSDSLALDLSVKYHYTSLRLIVKSNSVNLFCVQRAGWVIIWIDPALRRCRLAEKIWHVVKVRHCHHVDKEVDLETEILIPADYLPDFAPRVIAHRCSHAIACNLDGRPSCVWAGTNPAYDPFKDET